jgi:hypothetical protein
MNQHDDYASVENNCQKFLKYLVEAITCHELYVETIQLILERLLESNTSTMSLSGTPSLPSIRVDSNYIHTNCGNELCASSPRTAVFNLQISYFSNLSTGIHLRYLTDTVSSPEFDDEHLSEFEEYDSLVSEITELEVR